MAIRKRDYISLDLRQSSMLIPAMMSFLKKKVVNRSGKHVIHKAVLWRKMLDEGKFGSLNDIAKKEGLTRARVTQIINLLKLPVA